MKKFLLISLLSIFVVSNSNADSNSEINVNALKGNNSLKENQKNENETAHEKLINIAFNKELFTQMINEVFDQISKQTKVKLPKEKLVNSFLEKMFSDEVKKLFMDIYKKYYTSEEASELLKFYDSAVGKKTLKIMPSLFAESNAIGVKYWQEIFQEFITQSTDAIKKDLENAE